MEQVIFTKSGMVGWGGEPIEGSAVRWLRMPCGVEAGVTLGDVFKAVREDKKLMEFLAGYSWSGSLELDTVEVVEPDGKDPIVELRVKAYLDVVDGELERSVDFCGVGSNGDVYSVGLTPLGELVGVPVVVSEEMEVCGETVRYRMSLLEVLDAIFWELSFYGGEKDKAGVVESLKKAVAEFKEEVQ